MRKKMISLMMTVAMGTVMISGATVVKADSDEKETVKLAVWSSGAADNFQKGADEFNKRQDKINFVVEMQSGDYSQYLGAKVASNDLPDMFFLNPYTQVQQFAATDRIVDLSEEGFATKIYDSVKDACSYDGKIYAYPMNLEMLGVYYNQELFEKAGITEVPKTFSQMKEVCEKLQASGITPFAATYKETWTLNHLFSCLQGAAVGDYESWVADMNAGKGLPNIEGYGGKGDMFVHINVWTPQKLTKEQREFFQSQLQNGDMNAEPTGKEKTFFEKVKDMFN